MSDHGCEPRRHTASGRRLIGSPRHGARRQRAKGPETECERATVVWGEEPDELLLDDGVDPAYVCGRCGTAVMMGRQSNGDFLVYCECRVILRCE
jgi:hypothetical protein